MVALEVGGQGQLLNASLGVCSSIWCCVESHWFCGVIQQSLGEANKLGSYTLNLLRAVWGSIIDVQGGTSGFLSNSC